MVVHPVVKGERSARVPESRLEEAAGLAEAIALDIRRSMLVSVSRIRPGTFIGAGGVEIIKAAVEAEEAELVVMDCNLTAIQQRNLEKALDAKVIDRTALILEIFGERARTKEGRLQVELAHLSYQRSRLVRSWTHLERQRGGLGFIGGPGETQIEIDRRLIGERIAKLKRELEDVKRTRELHRSARRKVPYPVVALVGYTNAGKSTLFNRLTRAEVMAKDLLFATLDPTMRSLQLPSGRSVILSDTVGFVSDLPHELVAAFRATLEEVLGADLVVHVRDISHPDTMPQKNDVEAVLSEMGLETLIEEGRLVEIYNKIDRLPPDELEEIENLAQRRERSVCVSALTGQGSDDVLALFDACLAEGMEEVDVSVPVSDGALIAWIYRNATVAERTDDEAEAHFALKMEPADLGRLRDKLGLPNVTDDDDL